MEETVEKKSELGVFKKTFMCKVRGEVDNLMCFECFGAQTNKKFASRPLCKEYNTVRE